MNRFAGVRPQAVALPDENPTDEASPVAGPVEFVASAAQTSAADWAAENRRTVEAALTRRGAALLRGFRVGGAEGFRDFVNLFSPQLLEYRERSTPRTEIRDRVYTSTEYPARQSIALHNEFSYSYTWPQRIYFCAETPADEGGQTPIAESRSVYQQIPAEIREKFARLGVTYVRNYGTGVDLSWREAFQTEDRAEVERHCAGAQVSVEWLDGDRLRTRQTRPAVTRLPSSGDTVWFNQAHLFHVSNLGAESEREMRSVFSEHDLPRNAVYGDGSPITNEELDEVRRAFERCTHAELWQTDDVLILANMRFAHGRYPYRGQRRVLTALAEPYTLEPALRRPGAVT